MSLAPGKKELDAAPPCRDEVGDGAFDSMPTPAKGRDKCANLDAIQIDLVVGSLIGDHDVEVSKGLSQKTRQDDRRRTSAARRNKHVDEGQDEEPSIKNRHRRRSLMP